MAKSPKKNDNFYTVGEIEKYNPAKSARLAIGTKHSPDRSLASTINLQAGFNRRDRLFDRPEQKLPTGHSDIIAVCQAIYRKVGMIRNIIDLMADFAAEGLDFKHPIKAQQRFYESWAKRTDIKGRVHDFMKLLLRDANVIIRRKTVLITPPVVKEMTKAEANIDVVGLTSVEEALVQEQPEKIRKEKMPIKKKEIPWKYTFLSPVVIEKIGGEVGRFLGGDRLAIRIPADLRNSIRNPKTDAEREEIKRLPQEVIEAVKNSKNRSTLVALDPFKMFVDYYKKDDWEDWGTPFLYGIIEDVLLKEKMKEADKAALDGVINVTRIWKLGDHKEKILPTEAGISRLVEMLEANVGGGIKNIIWDSMIDMQVDYPPVDKILGDAKYTSVNRDIMKGLGVPEALVGGVDLATRNAETAFIQLKTLIERLEYVRSRCIRWLQNELAMIAKAMNFKTVPTISFGTMSLRDEAAEKQLMVQLVDRGIVSVEAVHEVFGRDFMFELQRLKDEEKIRDKNPPILERASPYYRPESQMRLQQEFELESDKLNESDNGGGDNPNGDQPKDSGDNPSGRPPNLKDTNPRDTRTEKTLSVYRVKGDEFLTQIDTLIDPLYLQSKNAKNMRALTKNECSELEKIKFAIFSTIRPDDKITSDLIHERSVSKYSNLFNIFNTMYEQALLRHAEILGKSPKLSERRILAVSMWADLVCV